MDALLVGVALVYATVVQGAFAADQAVVVFGLVVLAAAVSAVGRRRMPRSVAVAVGLLVVLAAWTAARAAGLADGGSGGPAGAGAGGNWLGAAVWAGLPIIAIAAVAVAVAGLAARARAVLTAVVIGAGLSVAATGWAGVAWHIEPLALVSSGLWRASSTLTYANASASFLVTALFVTAATAGRLGPRPARLVTAALLVGLLATMSRAGLVALVIGLAVAAALPGRRPRLTRRPLAALWPAVPGAAIAAAGLLPGLAEESVPRPLVAVAAMAAGLGFATLTPHRAAAVPTPDHAAAGRAPDPAAARHAFDPAAVGHAFDPAAVGHASDATAAGGAAATGRRVLVGAAVVAALLAAVPLAAGQQAGPVGALVARQANTATARPAPRMPVDLGIVLVAGLTMALAGCTPGAMTLAALSAPAAAASAPQSVSAHSAPSVEVVAEHSAPVAAYSAPAYCMDFTTPNGRITVGEASAPQCVVINAAPVADHSAPVAAASAPQCVGIVTPTVDMRRC